MMKQMNENAVIAAAEIITPAKQQQIMLNIRKAYHLGSYFQGKGFQMVLCAAGMSTTQYGLFTCSNKHCIRPQRISPFIRTRVAKLWHLYKILQ